MSHRPRRRRISPTYRVEFLLRRSRRLTSQAAADFFFRAAAVAFNVQFFDAIIEMTEFLVFVQFSQYQKTRQMTNNRQCSGIIILFTYVSYVTGLHNPVVLWTKMSSLSVGLY